jgi:hypothetical protein
MAWIVSVDLGQVADFTAVAAVEVSGPPPGCPCFVGFLSRWRGVSYPETVRRLGELVAQPDLREATVVVDQGGVGRGVIDAVREALPGRSVYGITLTHGQRVTRGQDLYDLNAPKRDVIAAAQLKLQANPKLLTIARELPDRAALEDELTNYRVKISEHLNELFTAARETDHDDMVIAVAMACWAAESLPVGPHGEYGYDREALRAFESPNHGVPL